MLLYAPDIASRHPASVDGLLGDELSGKDVPPNDSAGLNGGEPTTVIQIVQHRGFQPFSDFSSDDPMRMLMPRSRPPAPPTFLSVADLWVW